MITVLVVDDQENVRRGLKMRLAIEPDIQVVGEATNGQSAIDAVHALHPDVVVMDIEMPCMDGIAAARMICAEEQSPGIIVLSLHDDVAVRARCKEAGAVAFVAKHQSDAALLDAIRAAGCTDSSC